MIAAAAVAVQKDRSNDPRVTQEHRDVSVSWLVRIDTRGDDGRRRNANRAIFGDVRRTARVPREDAPRLCRVDDTRGTTQNKHGLGRPREMTRARSAPIPRLRNRNESRKFEITAATTFPRAYIRSRRMHSRISVNHGGGAPLKWRRAEEHERRESRFATHGHPIGVFPSDLLALGLPLFERMLLFVLELHGPR